MDYALNHIYYLLLFRLKHLFFCPFQEVVESLTGANVSLVTPARFP